MSTSVITRRAAIALGTACIATNSFAQFTTPALSFIVPQPAGNPTDGVARKIQPLLQKDLGLTVVVENIPGAGGALGIQKALNTPTGFPVLVIGSQTEPILTPLAISSARYRPEDLRPIGLIGRTPYILAGRPDLPATTLQELVDLARRMRLKPLSHGNIGQGSMIHLLGEQWARKSGIELVQVPYRGVPPMVQDLMGGQIDLGFLPLGGNVPSLVDSGKLRAFGVSSNTQSKRLPKLQSISMQSSDLSEFAYGTWATVFVPRSLPESLVRKLHEALTKALEDQGVRAYSIEGGAELADPMTLAQLERFYENEIQLHRALAQSIGLKPE